jgi:hypothetical protein
MFHINLVPNISALRVKTDGGTSVGMSEGVGLGSAEATVRYSKVKRIILPDFGESGLSTSLQAVYLSASVIAK